MLLTKKKIKTKKLIKIGITGSNGKTSVKNFLQEILINNFKVTITPKNFNTPKGVIYTINKLIKDETELVIFEMGARRKGDIEKLCKITSPNIGILTNISPQHLETFHNIETIYKTKNELSNYLKNSPCIYTYNNPLSFNSYLNKQGEKILVGIIDYHKITLKSKKQSTKFLRFKTTFPAPQLKTLNVKDSLKYKLDIYTKDIKIVNNSYSFSINSHDEQIRIQTKLLGKHNILNILCAVGVSKLLGLSLSEIQDKINALRPVEHRLELIKGRLNILDDSYNCSLESAKNSLEVLSLFPNTKCVCTPGIIEGGANQEELNMELCRIIKTHSDIQIFVGKTNRKAFQKVFENKKSAYFVDTLNDAQKLFITLLKENDALLLLNDLPDDYN